MAGYYVLSCDGGGIRGVLTAAMLVRLEAAYPFLDRVDLFAGTSTGGIIALGLAAGYSPQEILDLYLTLGETVFADTFLDDVRDLGKLVGAEYSIDNLARALRGRFQDLRLVDLSPRVLISTFDLDNNPADPDQLRTWKAKFFHNYPGPDSDGDHSVVDVALRTAAAPTYFPVYQGYIDGGVVASNPSMCALAQALHPATGGQDIESVVLLSMGTGHNPRFLETQSGDWGLAQWARYLVDLMLEGSANLANYQCRQTIGERFMRINPRLPEPIGLDRVDQIDRMVEIAEEADLGEAVAWLQQFFPSSEPPGGETPD